MRDHFFWSRGRPLFALLALASASNASPTKNTLVVLVDHVRSTEGVIHVDICSENNFLMSCHYSGEAKAVVGTTSVIIDGVPRGTYAAQVFHDENMNHKVDRGLFGIPKEGVGFSNNFKIGFRAPKFSETSFVYDGSAQEVKIHLKYFLPAKAY